MDTAVDISLVEFNYLSYFCHLMQWICLYGTTFLNEVAEHENSNGGVSDGVEDTENAVSRFNKCSHLYRKLQATVPSR